MLEKVSELAETGIKTVKGLNTLQKAGAVAVGLGVVGALLLMASAEDEEIVPATNVEVSDGAETSESEEVEDEVAPAE